MKLNHRFNRLLSTFGIFLLLGNCSGKSSSHNSVDLSGNDWVISTSDKSEYALPEISHTGWDTVSLPGNINSYMDESDGNIWLRKNFDFQREYFRGNPAVYLGKVYESDQVYINGIKIGDNGGKTVNFGRHRIYPIPLSAIQEGENLIAIRIGSRLSGAAGILSTPLEIVSTNKAYDDVWKHTTKEFIYICFFFFIGLFYMLNFLRMRDHKEYLSFSLFAFVYCIYEFTRNDFRFNILDHFVLFKFLEYSTLLFIPYLFIRFVEDFFAVKRFAYAKIYLLLTCGFVLLLAIIPNPVFWYGFIGYWDMHLPFALGYTIFLTIRKIKENMVGAYVNLLGLVYILYAILKQISVERGWIYADSSMETSVIFYFFIMTLALRLQFLFIKRGILKRYDQLKEADSLREKVFNHMDVMISDSLRKMHAMILGLLSSSQADSKSEKKESKETKGDNPPLELNNEEIINEIENIQSDLQPLMDDIIELSRLEVMDEVPFKTSIPFVDFIKEVIPSESITYSIRVSEDTLIENSLELINSIVIRLIDFPAIKDFTHNDLIITQDLRGNIHFRFLLFHKNPKVAIRLYNELSTSAHPEDPNTIKWQIIQQIARLLEAKLEFKVIKKKYLRIDLGLKAEAQVTPTSQILPVTDKSIDTQKSRKDWKDELVELWKKGKNLIPKRK